jgi:[ribosomal protein S5]-alanine N-acetyltransferase
MAMRSSGPAKERLITGVNFALATYDLEPPAAPRGDLKRGERQPVAVRQPMQPSRLRRERPWQEHANLYRDLFADPAVGAALWPGALGGPRSAVQASEMLVADIIHWQEESFGPWVFFELATGMFVGRGGLCCSKFAGRDCVELLYAVRSDVWGSGYATEMAMMAVAHARRLGLADVLALTATTNGASWRVLEKVGMRFEGIVEHAGLPHRLGRLLLGASR